jgi:glutathione S-transferase
MNVLPILYSFRRCPYAIRARLALCQAGITVELREVDLQRKPPALLAVSAAATVPVLDAGEGVVLLQSLDIMRWALGQSDRDHWMARGDAAFNQRLVDTTDGDFKHALDRYKYANRHPQRSQADYRNDAVACLIEPLEEALARDNYLGGSLPCWADAAVFPFIRQFAGVDAAWWREVPLPATRRWLQGWQDSALFALCMHKYAVWTPSDPPTRFPPLRPT